MFAPRFFSPPALPGSMPRERPTPLLRDPLQILLLAVLVTAYTAGVPGLFHFGNLANRVWTEVPVLLLAAHLLGNSRLVMAPGLLWLVLLFVWTVFGTVVLQTSFWECLLFMRWPIYEYVVYCAAWNARMDGHKMHRLLKVILGLWLLQIAVAFAEVFLLGTRREAMVGTMSSGGGAGATVFPLLVLAYSFAIYLRYRSSVLMLLLSAGAAFVGFASAKRGIYFYIPLFVLVMLANEAWVQRDRLRLHVFAKPLLAIALILPAYIYGLANSGGVSAYGVRPGHERVDLSEIDVQEQVSHAIKVVREHETLDLRDDKDRLGSRTGLTLHMLDFLANAPLTRFLFGSGYGSFIGGEAFDVYGFYYGATGWTMDVMAVGVPGMVFHILFFLAVFRNLPPRRIIGEPPLRSGLRTGTRYAVLVFFVMYFTYISSVGMAGWFTFTFLLMAGLTGGGPQVAAPRLRPHEAPS